MKSCSFPSFSIVNTIQYRTRLPVLILFLIYELSVTCLIYIHSLYHNAYCTTYFSVTTLITMGLCMMILNSSAADHILTYQSSTVLSSVDITTMHSRLYLVIPQSTSQCSIVWSGVTPSLWASGLDVVSTLDITSIDFSQWF